MDDNLILNSAAFNEAYRRRSLGHQQVPPIVIERLSGSNPSLLSIARTRGRGSFSRSKIDFGLMEDSIDEGISETADTLGSAGGFTRRPTSPMRGVHGSLEERKNVSTISPIPSTEDTVAPVDTGTRPKSAGSARSPLPTATDGDGVDESPKAPSGRFQAVGMIRGIQDKEIEKNIRLQKSGSGRSLTKRIYPSTRTYMTDSEEDLLCGGGGGGVEGEPHHVASDHARRISVDADALPHQDVVAQPMTLTSQSPIEDFRAYGATLKHPAVFMNLHDTKALCRQHNEFSQICNDTLAALADLEGACEEASMWKDNFLKANVPSRIKLELALLFSQVYRSRSALNEPLFELIKQVRIYGSSWIDKKVALVELEEDYRRQMKALDIAVRMLEQSRNQIKKFRSDKRIHLWEKLTRKLIEVRGLRNESAASMMYSENAPGSTWRRHLASSRTKSFLSDPMSGRKNPNDHRGSDTHREVATQTSVSARLASALRRPSVMDGNALGGDVEGRREMGVTFENEHSERSSGIISKPSTGSSSRSRRFSITPTSRRSSMIDSTSRRSSSTSSSRQSQNSTPPPPPPAMTTKPSRRPSAVDRFDAVIRSKRPWINAMYEYIFDARANPSSPTATSTVSSSTPSSALSSHSHSAAAVPVSKVSERRRRAGRPAALRYLSETSGTFVREGLFPARRRRRSSQPGFVGREDVESRSSRATTSDDGESESDAGGRDGFAHDDATTATTVHQVGNVVGDSNSGFKIARSVSTVWLRDLLLSTQSLIEDSDDDDDATSVPSARPRDHVLFRCNSFNAVDVLRGSILKEKITRTSSSSSAFVAGEVAEDGSFGERGEGGEGEFDEEGGEVDDDALQDLVDDGGAGAIVHEMVSNFLEDHNVDVPPTENRFDALLESSAKPEAVLANMDLSKTWFSMEDVMELTLLHAQQMQILQDGYQEQLTEMSTILTDSEKAMTDKSRSYEDRISQLETQLSRLRSAHKESMAIAKGRQNKSTSPNKSGPTDFADVVSRAWGGDHHEENRGDEDGLWDDENDEESNEEDGFGGDYDGGGRKRKTGAQILQEYRDRDARALIERRRKVMKQRRHAATYRGCDVRPAVLPEFNPEMMAMNFFERLERFARDKIHNREHMTTRIQAEEKEANEARLRQLRLVVPSRNPKSDPRRSEDPSMDPNGAGAGAGGEHRELAKVRFVEEEEGGGEGGDDAEAAARSLRAVFMPMPGHVPAPKVRDPWLGKSIADARSSKRLPRTKETEHMNILK